MKMFNKILMGSEDNVNLLKTGVFYNEDDEKAAVEDGAFVSICDLETHDLYNGDLVANDPNHTLFKNPLKDFNARKITAYNADEPIYGFVDVVEVSHADVMGVTYRIGDKIAGIGVEKGATTRVRMLEVGDEFYLGDENFDDAESITINESYAIPEAGKTTMKVVGAIDKTQFCIKIEDVRDLIMGQAYEGSKLYRCRVVNK